MRQGEMGTLQPLVCTHRRSAPGLYEPIVEGERLHDGGVSLGALLEFLQRQLPVSILQKHSCYCSALPSPLHCSALEGTMEWIQGSQRGVGIPGISAAAETLCWWGKEPRCSRGTYGIS